MEEPKVTTGNTPQKSALATWSLILGIIAIPLCFLLIPGVLAVIFGIIALVKINSSTGLLTGKGKAIAGLILGGASFILLPIVGIVAAIVIPNLIAHKKAASVMDVDHVIAQVPSLQTQTEVSNDGLCQISLPAGWSTQTNLHADANIQVANIHDGLYLIVLTESKSDFENMSLEGHSELTRQRFLNNLQNGQIGEPNNFKINDQPALQYQISGTVDNVNIVYLHTTVEGKEHFHQIVAWTLSSKFEKNKAALESVINSFKELGQ